jgi:prepilin-type processing-associated H-X9-DG protein
MARILPFLEQNALYQQINFNTTPWWQHPINETPMPLFVCPADIRGELIANYGGNAVAMTDYIAVSGTDQLAFDGVLHVNSSHKMLEILDGTSNTLLVGERPPSTDLVYGWWFAGAGTSPAYFGTTDVCLGVNEIINFPTTPYSRDTYRAGQLNDPGSLDKWHFWSLHSGGANFLLADGSARFITYSVSQTVINAAATRNGGEALSMY